MRADAAPEPRAGARGGLRDLRRRRAGGADRRDRAPGRRRRGHGVPALPGQGGSVPGAVIEDRIRDIVERRPRPARSRGSGRRGLFAFLRAHGAAMGCHRPRPGRGTRRRCGVDINRAVPEAEGRFPRRCSANLLAAGQRAGTVRPDVTVPRGEGPGRWAAGRSRPTTPRSPKRRERGVRRSALDGPCERPEVNASSGFGSRKRLARPCTRHGRVLNIDDWHSRSVSARSGR